MCGRYSLAQDIKRVSQYFSVTPPNQAFPLRYNAAPHQFLPVISSENPNEISLYRWGLVPFWAADENIANKLINARAETVFQKAAFQRAISSRRCLILADGFYEWKSMSRGAQPFRFVLKNEEPFALAGLWEKWRTSTGEILKTFAIITTAANDVVKEVHDRMPVILTRQSKQAWLSDTLDDKDIDHFLKPFSSRKMRSYPVSKALNSPHNDGPDLICPATVAEQEQLTLELV